MSAMRQEYFKDLLRDCMEVCEEMGIEPEDQGPVIAALVQSDSLNGLRKAMLSPGYILAQNAMRNYAPAQSNGAQQY